MAAAFMTVALQLSSDEAHVLQEVAQDTGTTMDAVLQALIAQVSPRPEVIAGTAEAPADTAEAQAERRREQEEVEANIRRWHEEQAPA